jgi:lipopolysaccharide transport system ATP-binding protein
MAHSLTNEEIGLPLRQPRGEPGEIALSMERVGLYYRRRGHGFKRHRYWALKDISFDVRLGETVGIIGSNGSGKSTVMRVLGGIVSVDRGRFTNHGVIASLHSLNVGLVDYLTGRENAFLSGMLLGLSRQEIRDRMDAIIEYSGLEDFIDKPVATYSSGMIARLGFSVAFQAQPDVLLVDEIWGVGDQEFTVKSTQSMLDMSRSNRTIVVVSHSLDLVRDFCDRAVWIDSGETRMVGPSAEVVASYAQSATRRAPTVSHE